MSLKKGWLLDFQYCYKASEKQKRFLQHSNNFDERVNLSDFMLVLYTGLFKSGQDFSNFTYIFSSDSCQIQCFLSTYFIFCSMIHFS